MLSNKCLVVSHISPLEPKNINRKLPLLVFSLWLDSKEKNDPNINSNYLLFKVANESKFVSWKQKLEIVCNTKEINSSSYDLVDFLLIVIAIKKGLIYVYS